MRQKQGFRALALVLLASGSTIFACGEPSAPEGHAPDGQVGPKPVVPSSADASSVADGSSESFEASVPEGAATDAAAPAVDDGFMPRGILAGNYHTVCNVREAGAVVCWGWGGSGQFGARGTGSGPTVLTGIQSGRTVGSGIDFVCASTAEGTVQCVGDNSSGELGRADAGGESTSLAPVDGVTDAVYTQAGYRYACALKASGTVVCWGSNREQELGASALEYSRTPVTVAGTEGSVALAVGSTHACVMRADRSVWCWGKNDGGQLGVPSAQAATSATPVMVPGLRDVVMVSAGVNMTCALDTSGRVSCWGCESGGGACSVPPTLVAGVSNVRGISAGAYHVCAVRADGKVFCWGYNAHGQLGAETPERSVTPMMVAGIDDAVAVTTGAETSCVLRTGGHVACWGENHIGQLGSFDAGIKSASPVVVPGL